MATSTSTESFWTQQDHASNRIHEMDDEEKMAKMKEEIDNLRTQIKESGVLKEYSEDETFVASSSSTSTSSSSSLGSDCSAGYLRCNPPMLMSVFLIVGVVIVAIWRRRRFNNIRGGMMGRRNPASLIDGPVPEFTMQFELQDAHDYQAPSAFNTTNTAATTTFV